MGKLIDSDNFGKRLNGALVEFMNRVGMPIKYRIGLLAFIVKVLYEEPEVDQGRWEIDDCGKLICSSCKSPSAMARQFAGMQYKSRYCPNCGSRMDERKDGEHGAEGGKTV